MAARFWVGGSGTWDASSTTHWSATSGGASGASAPTSSDTATFDSLSNATGYTCTIGSGAVCSDLTTTAPLTGNLSLAFSSALGVYGNLSWYAAMGRTGVASINFQATATGKTVDFGGVGLNNNLNFLGVGGGWTLSSDLTNSNSVSHTEGTLDTNGKTVTTTVFSTTGASTRTLTLGASIISCGTWTLSGSGLTFNENTSSIRVTSATTFTGGGETYYEVQLNSTANTIAGSNSYTTLTRTGTATRTDTLTLTAGTTQTVTGTFTCAGNSVTNRVLIETTAHGTQATISAATVTVSNTDFKDTIGTGAGSWNFAASAAVGNCGNNTGITATTAVTQYLQIGASANWSTAGNWFLATNGGGGAGRVPLPQDTAILDANSFTAGSIVLTQDMPRIGPVDFTGTTNTPTWTLSTAFSTFGSLTLVSGMTLSGTATITWEARSTTTLTSAGKSFSNSLIVDAPANTLTIQDAFTIGAANTLEVRRGSFSHNNFAVSCGIYQTDSGFTRTVTWGTADLTLTGSSATILAFSPSTGLTFTVGTGVIKCTYSGATGTRTVVTSTTVRVAPVQVTAGTDTFSISRLLCRGFDMTGFSGVFAGSGDLDVVVGAITRSATESSKTFTGAVSAGTVTGTVSFTSNGKAWASTITFAASSTNVWQLADALSNTGAVRLSTGTLDTNGFAVSSSNCILVGSATTRRIIMTSNTWTITGTGTVIDFTPSGSYSFTQGTSTFKLTDASASAKQINGGNFTFYDLWFSPAAGTGSLTFQNSNTFRDFLDTGTAAHSLLFTAGTTQNFTLFRVYGSSGNIVTIDTPTAANHTLNCIAGPIICDFLSVKNSQATGRAVWYAGGQSTDQGGNSGWKFYGPARTAQGAAILTALSTPHY